MMSLLQIPATLKQPMSCEQAYLLTNLKFPQRKWYLCECLMFITYARRIVATNLTNMDHSSSYHQEIKGYFWREEKQQFE